MKFEVLKAILEWAMVAAVLLLLFVWIGHTRPAQAQGYDYGWRDYGWGGDPEFYSDIQNPPDMIIYRDRGYGRYRSREPEYYSDIQNKPDMTIYRDRGRFSRH